MSLDIYLYAPTACPHCHGDVQSPRMVYEANITHNLAPMAKAAGIYELLWRPDEIGVTHARQIINGLRIGIENMKTDPPRYRALNASNGWGTYERFVPWLEKLLDACEADPNALIKVSR